MHPFSSRRKQTTAIFHSLLVFAVRFGLTEAARNVTVDDQTGDELTGLVPTYTPLGSDSGDWTQGATCTGCLVRPDVSKVHEGTWHDATHRNGVAPRVAEISFNGTAVYAFFIIANTITGATTLTNMSFSLDGEQVGTFEHVPDSTSNFEYNVPGYVNTSIPDGSHQLLIQSNGDDSLILFDYLIYTASDASSSGGGTETTSSNAPGSTSSGSSDQSKGSSGSKKIGPIVGAVVGVAAVAIITVLALICWRRRGRGGMFFGDRRKEKITLDEDGSEHSMHNTTTPLPFTIGQGNNFGTTQPHMAESQYLMPSSEHTSSSRLLSTAVVNSSSLAVQNPDGSGSSALRTNGAMLKAKERQTEIVRQMEEMQQQVARLRSQNTPGGSAQLDNSATTSRTMSDSEAEMRSQIAALQAEVERLQHQQIYLQPPPQYAEGSTS